jgi:hypothetical protein
MNLKSFGLNRSQGSKLEMRLSERNRELQKDVEDRQREKEEIEELRAQIVREGYKDPNAELERRLAMQERLNNPALFFQVPIWQKVACFWSIYFYFVFIIYFWQKVDCFWSIDIYSPTDL